MCVKAENRMVTYRSYKTAVLKYLFSKNCSTMIMIINSHTLKVTGQEDIDITIGGVFVQFTLYIITQASVSITQGHFICTDVILECS